ncbi:TetR/AcrR family transcriptional regulator [Sphingomonas endophytica]|uniref:HTH tetR-type domain-containing protein n=1 Tax=Sphingomonas endophytica TaxID=869719 RepID=A0A147I9V1_9SPHN|nr:TetR/AcrR family transcriptional regulator [Sphingomonas endophytica]KTT76676.1 hypothetical protein NS334_00165 [Sphingomonas endophytica]
MKKPELAPKKRPSQPRSHDTFELIVETAGRLLEQVGFEQLTTNLVCKEAGLSPPALYRYFPNKYAILKEMGDRLMRAQDAAALDGLEDGGLVDLAFEERVARSLEIQNRVIEITRSFPGSIAITRALRAVPMLDAVRIASRNAVAAHHAIAYARFYPAIPIDALQTCAKLTIEMHYAAMEAVLEDPGPDSQGIIEGVCRATLLYADDLQRRHAAARTASSEPAPA